MRVKKINHYLVYSLLLVILILYGIFSYTSTMGDRRPIFLGLNYTKMVAVAISDLNYGLKGYVGYKTVFDALKSNGFTIKNYGNGKVLDNALHQALEIQDVGTEIVTIAPYGLGNIDYIKFSFALFGYGTQSLLYFYYLLLTIQVLVFLLEYWKEKQFIALLIIYLLSHYVVVLAIPINNDQITSVFSPRFHSILGILPAIHILLIVLLRKPFNYYSSIYVCIQSVIFFVSYWARLSTAWMLIMLAAVSCYFIIRLLISQWKQSEFNLVSSAGLRIYIYKLSRLWPIVILLFIVIPSQAIFSKSLHPIYQNEEQLAVHHFWFPIVSGLALHSDIRLACCLRDNDANDIVMLGDDYQRVCYGSNQESDYALKAFLGRKICDSLVDAPKLMNKISKWRNTYRTVVVDIQTQANDQYGWDSGFKWLRDHNRDDKAFFTFDANEEVDLTDFNWFHDQEVSDNARAFDWEKDFNYRDHEETMSLVTKEIIVNEPLKVLALVSVIKPLQFLNNYRHTFARLQNFIEINNGFKILIISSLLYAIFLFRKSYDTYLARQSVFILFSFSMIVHLVFYSNPSNMLDAALIFTMCLIILVITIFDYILKILNRVHKIIY